MLNFHSLTRRARKENQESSFETSTLYWLKPQIAMMKDFFFFLLSEETPNSQTYVEFILAALTPFR